MAKYEPGDIKYIAFSDHVEKVSIVRVGCDGYNLKRRVKDPYVVSLLNNPVEQFVLSNSELYDNPVEASRAQINYASFDEEDEEESDEDEAEDEDEDD